MKLLSLVLGACLSLSVAAQEFQLEWGIEKRSEGEQVSALTFEGASYNEVGLPQIASEYSLPVSGNATLELFSPEFTELSPQEISALGALGNFVSESFVLHQAYTSDGGAEFITYRLTPLRRNSESGKLEKLVSFDFMPVRIQNNRTYKSSSWASSSELASGSWVKMPIAESGLHVVQVEDLISAGILTSGATSSSLLAFHNAGGTLPEPIAEGRYDDLRQIAIHIEDGGDGSLEAGDRVYLYAQGPDEIRQNKNNPGQLTHLRNVYARRSFVFFTYNPTRTGLRVETQPWTGGAATIISQGFDELQFHEEDTRNIVGTGREWFGEIFDFQLSQTFNFKFPNRITSEPVRLRFKAAASSPISLTRFEVEESGTVRQSMTISASNGTFLYSTHSNNTTFSSSATDLNFTVRYNRGSAPSSVGYLDYISVQVRRAWQYSSGGFIARDLDAISSGGVVEYSLPQTNVWVWDVTEPTRPFAPQRTAAGKWNASADSLRTYLVYDKADAIALTNFTRVDNQNLHGLTAVDMVIVSHPNFLAEAQRLADFHSTNDNLKVEVITPEVIYNEFSGGAQDITAIRDFARMLYKRNQQPLEYLLLFGDASYDYLNRVPNMQNFVPIFESIYSNSLYTSFMTDDYYSCLDDNEGVNVTLEKVDINTGRLPVKTTSEAKAVVDKIVNYAIAENSFGEWRNRLCFVTDDVDESWETVLTREPEMISQMLDTVHPSFNIEKIYSDSYSQVSTSGSQAYPDARESLFRAVERGNLVTAYTGHGGEVGWASERLLQLQDINRWSNGTDLPLFITITCEFTRFDDPFRTSAGEQVFLNPDGGAIGLISTTRVVFVQGAIDLNDAVFNTMFERENGEYPTLGDIVRRSKNEVTDADRVRFSLIGDPALRLNIPVHEVVLDSINGIETALVDTIRARETVTLEGHVDRDGGGLFSNFNGEVVVTVFDKAVEQETKRNDGVGGRVTFTQQENVIFRGRATVENGYWEISFVVPRDINYTYGQGKISLYAENGVTDAKGANKTFYVGGLGDLGFTDLNGPEILLFMNDTNFVNGGLTDENPIGLALLYDESGINVVGNGLGHDVIGVLDDDPSNSFRLNSYYEGDLDTYKSGRIEYPFYDLENGPHTLDVRVWDVMNNVSEARVNFIVADRSNLVIEDLFNYPNPFSDFTRFSFEHNRPNEDLEVELFIVDLNGSIVNHQSQNLSPTGTRTLNMTWDGTGTNGTKVSNGLYVFRLVVRSKADGSQSEMSERLVYLK
ncbi:MAG: type IX secretion system sortase PorU [Flavobacteriia bacterium]|nr:type IX secretion system sortase PorU [Flavobacteriia bacterium]